ncbi:MAG: PSD1 domain-containing protein [Planctomyces sp.]|nr:PSD1 domain-containing protein [Planctomyces sp.]
MNTLRYLSAFAVTVVITSTPELSFADEFEFFESKIRPLLISNCLECHAGQTPEGSLNLDTREGFEKGGMLGAVINRDHPAASAILERVLTSDQELQMPPEKKLSDSEIADLRHWLETGAHWPESSLPMQSESSGESHWAFQPVQDVSPPVVNQQDLCRTPIDNFILAGYSARGLQPVAAADKRTLLRRASLDLTGLLPTPEDVIAFESDSAPDAFSQVVDRLLSSPAYGERWGRHWLDLARYADTSGDGTDTPIPEARYYRNYVINSMNSDLPWNEFLKEQIAGDLMAKQDPSHPRSNDRIIATGFIALSRRFGNSAFAEMNLIIDDTIDTIGKSTLGLTLGCSRCHHHKFDPITLNDYYGIYGYFENTQYPHAGTEHQKDRSHFATLTKNDALPADYESLEAWAVSDKIALTGNAAIRIGGDLHRKGDTVPRSYLSIITKDLPQIPENESGRLQFANWLASDSNPLSTRVIVNRVWQYHFGQGIVASSSNFGLQGSKPSHPELLDWLTTDFVRNGWSVKHLHRQIMLSSVYQLSSAEHAENESNDQANTGLWRFTRRRMDAETLRDNLLNVSMLLEPGGHGRHPFKPTDKLKYSQGNPFNETIDHRHRSVYLMTARLNKHPFLALFDGPDSNKTTENRRESTVSLQALYMMNSPFVRDVSTGFANRLISYSSDPELRIQHAWQLAFSRPATAEDVADCLLYLQEYSQHLISSGTPDADAHQLAWVSLARTLLSSNEFVYVD